MSSNIRRNLDDSASFQSDEDAQEMGHLSVSVSELNQLREHVRAMRQNMTQKHKDNMRNGLGSCGSSVVSGIESVTSNHCVVLEEVDLTTAGRNRTGASVTGGNAAGLVRDEEAISPEEHKRLFRLAVVANIFFMLAAILYICAAHGDLQWAQDVQGIPAEVLQADDDATWRDFQQKQKLNNNNNRRAARSLSMRMDEDTDYYDVMWNDLPPDIQLALMVLGHNQRTWNNDMTSQTEELPWSQLTAEQRDAAEIIGYDQSEWDWVEEEEEQLISASGQAYSSTGVDDDGRGDDQAENDDRNNDDGEDDRYGDADDAAPGDDRYEADDLAPEDDRYDGDDAIGDAVDDAVDADDGAPQDANDAVDGEYADDAAGDDEMADNGVTTAEVFDQFKGQTDDYFPDSENPTETSAATTITPTSTEAPQYTVDGAQVTTAAQDIPTFDNAKAPEDLMVWGSYGWEDLPPDIQKAFEILGYNEELWNSGGTALTEDLYWSDLTPAQQEQAAVLGYNQQLWDAAEDGDYDITDSAPSPSVPQNSAVIPTVGTLAPDAQEVENKNDDYPIVGGAAMTSDSGGDDFVRIGDVDVQSNTVVLFFAAFFMMAVGVLNWLREHQVFHMWMVQGGLFGILGAICMSFSDFASLLLQTVSVHCFLLEAVFLLKLRKTIRPVEGLESLSYALWGADIFYAAGALIQVVLVYWLHIDNEAIYDISLAYGEVFAAWLWFLTAVLYTINTMALANKRIQEDATTRTLTIERRHPSGERYTIRPAAIQLRPRHSVVLT